MTDDPAIEEVLASYEQARAALLEKRFGDRRLNYSSSYVAHTPDYTIVDLDELTEALSSGRVSYDSSEREVEYAARHGPGLIVVMGVETVVPSAGRPNAGKRVERRFSDIYRREAGAWRHEVRHAHIVSPGLADGIAPPAAPRLRISDDPHTRAVLDFRRRTLAGIGEGASSDPTGLYSSTFMANTPMGTLVSGPQMRALFSGGGAGYSSVTQRIEYAGLHGSDFVVVMGGEIVVPRQGLPNAGRNIHRRFTDAFRFEDGAWRHDLRHANVVRID